ncbi:Do family serine endopeptidase [uncultured Nevskia sp.]|uniref:Do family serine endopeptidase n=1 Tax=uncultured Nevskia sp. TaxID=228950 RepID=UPI0025F223C4|nr:Do family serine endopeptidase [uncultured Nevskia sp.]
MRIVAGPSRAVLFLSLAAAVLLSACSSERSAGLPELAGLVEKVSPSVVNISAMPAEPEQVASGSGSDGRPVPDWLKKFLDEHGNQAPGKGADGAAPGSSPDDGRSDSEDSEEGPDLGSPDGGPDGGFGGEQSLGSGFILWADGYIITNHHVVKNAKEIVVRLSDRRQFPAELVGSDERSDLALLKIDAKDLPAVKLADSRKTRVGDWVLAIGSPFGFDYTVTAGIILAKGRNLDTEQYVPFIQTDAAVNPGNSGGPLFNLKGEVVGVNSQIYSQNGGFQGVAFAIPMDVAAKVAKSLKETGRVRRGWLGIVMQEVDRNLAKSFGMDKPGGALIARILPDSPAEQAGLKAGDVVMKYNGQDVISYRTLKPLVGSSQPGDTITLDLLRDRKLITIKVEVGTLEADDAPPAPSGKPAGPTEPKSLPADRPLGATVVALTDDERRTAKVVSGGVRVTEVLPGPARDAGLIVSDVVLSIAGQEIASTERFAEVVGRLTPGQSVPMLVQRQGAPLFLALSVPAKTPAAAP